MLRVLISTKSQSHIRKFICLAGIFHFLAVLYKQRRFQYVRLEPNGTVGQLTTFGVLVLLVSVVAEKSVLKTFSSLSPYSFILVICFSYKSDYFPL